MYSIRVKYDKADLRVGSMCGKMFLKVAKIPENDLSEELEKFSKENRIQVFGYGCLDDCYTYLKFFNKYPAEEAMEHFKEFHKNLQVEVVED